MPEAWMVYPMFALMLLSGSVVVRLFRARVRAVKSGAVQAAYYWTYQSGAEPAEVAKLSRHFSNLFEAPVLFYAVCLASMASHQVSRTLVLLAWLYVLARAIHMVIHTGSNRLRARIGAYFGSWLVLLALWVVLVLQLLRS